MRKGFEPKLFFTRRGELLAFSTGSDACAEHECGTAPMQAHLSLFSDSQVLEGLALEARNGKVVKIPGLEQRKGIKKNLQDIKFFETKDVDGCDIGLLLFSPKQHIERSTDIHPWILNELRFFDKHEVSGAWDDESFAIAVKGTKNISALKAFHARLQAGNGIFAGTFLKEGEFSSAGGVCIAVTDLFRPEHRAGMNAAQAEFEKKFKLETLSRVKELNALMQAKKDGIAPGYIWATWKDDEVAYFVNPNYEAKNYISSFTHYSFEALRDWIKSPTKYKLVPLLH